MSQKIQCELAVLGGGPGGYTAAFRAADLGKDVVLIERYPRIGGVCLNVGCIPSKTLLHAAELAEAHHEGAAYGLEFPPPQWNLQTLQAKKTEVVEKLTGGLASLAKARKVRILTGVGQFISEKTLEVDGNDGRIQVEFESAIVAVGSRPVKLPFLPEDPRIWDSTDALEVKEIPPRLAVLGGGIIGLEMAQVYAALGSKVTIIEMLDQIIPPADADLVRPLARVLKDKYENIYTQTKLTSAKATKQGLVLSLEGKKAPEKLEVDALLVAVGRRPNGMGFGAQKAGVNVDERGFVEVDEWLKTANPRIWAIGDVIGNPMLAHKAVHEAKAAAEAICGEKSAFAPMAIPSVAYTKPEVAWVGLTEKDAKKQGVDFVKGSFPWAASGRALSADAQGMSKALFHPETHRLLGAAIVGERAGDLIAEAILAMEMGADAQDISLTVHAHPTFAETFAFAAEMVDGSITDALPPK
ncbi:MAG: dihydrolipoyl dehydrogenase [Spirochaetales bacterium]|nr:dihydrolipoyl dehydrogenase [Spirochaetales bacterium]